MIFEKTIIEVNKNPATNPNVCVRNELWLSFARMKKIKTPHRSGLNHFNLNISGNLKQHTKNAAIRANIPPDEPPP